MTRRLFRNVWLAGMVLFAAGCCKEPVPDPEMQRSVLIYMAANNNLSAHSVANIEALKKGFLPSNGNVIIYQDAPNALPRLFRLVKNTKTNTVEEELIEQYAAERATDPAVLTRSLNRMRELYPAKEYGLVLWSHGTGWVPAGTLDAPYPWLTSIFAAPAHIRREDLPVTKTFGEYKRNQDPGMELDDLAAAVPYHLSFILFDACLMGGVEVAYAMRHAADYLIASPAEIIDSGFPYDQIIQPMFLPQAGLEEVCNAFYRYYNEHPYESHRSATIALYRTESLEELAQVLKPIFEARRTELNQFSPSDVQHYANAPLYYDLDDFILRIATPSEYALFKSSLDKVVLHKRATEKFYTMVTSPAYIPVNYYSGISTYIPVKQQYGLHTAYKETEWNRAVGLLE